jgi:hypothetical protein
MVKSSFDPDKMPNGGMSRGWDPTPDRLGNPIGRRGRPKGSTNKPKEAPPPYTNAGHMATRKEREAMQKYHASIPSPLSQPPRPESETVRKNEHDKRNIRTELSARLSAKSRIRERGRSRSPESSPVSAPLSIRTKLLTSNSNDTSGQQGNRSKPKGITVIKLEDDENDALDDSGRTSVRRIPSTQSKVPPTISYLVNTPSKYHNKLENRSSKLNTTSAMINEEDQRSLRNTPSRKARKVVEHTLARDHRSHSQSPSEVC